ncbi:hypothetical protein LY78DRAFT_170286 [Colletotrichum sublineola]|nr:hypothetical protein LY78DRAFT_170286 [Colletotrichum sublineola]
MRDTCSINGNPWTRQPNCSMMPAATSRNRAINLSAPWPFLPTLPQPLFFCFSRFSVNGRNDLRRVCGEGENGVPAGQRPGETVPFSSKGWAGIREWPLPVLRHVQRVHHLLRPYRLHAPCKGARAWTTKGRDFQTRWHGFRRQVKRQSFQVCWGTLRCGPDT